MHFNDDDMSPEEVVQYAESVRGLANSMTFQHLIHDAREDCHRDWEAGKTAEAREAAFIHLQGIKSLEKQIQKAIDGGQRAAHQLKQ